MAQFLHQVIYRVVGALTRRFGRSSLVASFWRPGRGLAVMYIMADARLRPIACVKPPLESSRQAKMGVETSVFTLVANICNMSGSTTE
jgi:hypothetical protein